MISKSYPITSERCWGMRWFPKLFNHPTNTSNRVYWQLRGVWIFSFQGCMYCSQESTALWSTVGQWLASEDKKEQHPTTRTISQYSRSHYQAVKYRCFGFPGSSSWWSLSVFGPAYQPKVKQQSIILRVAPLKRPLKGRFKDRRFYDFLMMSLSNGIQCSRAILTCHCQLTPALQSV